MHFTLLFVLASAAIVTARPEHGVPSANDLPVQGYIAVDISEGRVTYPKGTPNGLYLEHNSTHNAYLGPIDSTTPLSARSLSKRQTSCDVSCSGNFGTQGNVNCAENALGNAFGGGLSFHNTISAVCGEVVAFGCDYGNGQTYTKNEFNFDVGCISGTCGSTQSGWNSHPTWKSTYGIAIGGYSC